MQLSPIQKINIPLPPFLSRMTNRHRLLYKPLPFDISFFVETKHAFNGSVGYCLRMFYSQHVNAILTLLFLSLRTVGPALPTQCDRWMKSRFAVPCPRRRPLPRSLREANEKWTKEKHPTRANFETAAVSEVAWLRNLKRLRSITDLEACGLKPEYARTRFSYC